MQLIICDYDPYNPIPMDENQGLDRYLDIASSYSATEKYDIFYTLKNRALVVILKVSSHTLRNIHCINIILHILVLQFFKHCFSFILMFQYHSSHNCVAILFFETFSSFFIVFFFMAYSVW